MEQQILFDKIHDIINTCNEEFKEKIQKEFPECNSIEEVKKLYVTEKVTSNFLMSTMRDVYELIKPFIPVTVNNISSNGIIEDTKQTLLENQNNLVSSITDLKNSLNSLQTTITTELKETENKIEKTNKSKLKEKVDKQVLEERFKHKYNCTIQNNESLVSIVNLILSQHPLILVSGKDLKEQVLEYCIEHDVNIV